MISRLSLRSRLVLGTIALAAVGLVAADVATYTSLRSYLYSRADSTLNAVHPGVESSFFGHDHRPDEVAPPGYCVELRTLAEKRVAATCQVAPGETKQPLPRYPSAVTLPSHPNSGEGDRIRFLTVPAVEGGGRYRVRASIEGDHPNEMLFIAAPLRNEDNTLHRLFLVELLVTAAVLAALAALGLWIVRLGLRPLREIESTAAAIHAGDLSHRVEVENEHTEVGNVGTAINDMLGRIEASDRRLRRFVADASHELRTPLAAVRAYAELFTRGAESRPEDLARAMQGITRESERMSVLVEDLLLLARLDEGRPLERERVQLDDLVRDAVEMSHALDPERTIDLSAKPVAVTGDGVRLRQAVDNLLSNVRSHTPAAAPVRVTVGREDGKAVVEVADSGPGLTSDELERVFERFYRADASRSRASGGVGLGLSIVAAVARAHGGTVTVRSEAGEGAAFRIELPAIVTR
ncbi:MAG TPA: HAMP domain-containing sensor histidine kinase [Gaiellaceae bacterium]|nr:HAMP domain-containing sensor histidine kinase [Gaiellaceae bacterium]